MLEHYSLRDTSFYKSVQFASVLAGNIKKNVQTKLFASVWTL